MTTDSNEETGERLPPLLIVPPEEGVARALAGQGQQEQQEMRVVAWTPPEGTRRTETGTSSFARFWRIDLPGGQELLEVHIPSTGLSVLYDVAIHDGEGQLI